MARMQGLSLAGGNRGLLVIAAIAGLAAAVLFIAAVNSGGDGSSTPLTAETATVVVAASDIAAGEEITSNMVEVKSVPGDDVIEGVLSVDKAVGQRARVLVAKGEQVTAAKVGAAAEGSGLRYVLPIGKQAAAIEVSEATQVGGNLLPGDRVDLLVTFQPTEPGEPVAVYSVLRNVEVLSVAQEAQEAVTAAQDAPAATESAASSGQVLEDVEKQPSATTVTVALSAEQAQLLACVQDHSSVSRVWLTLRAFGEPEPAEAMTVPQGYCQLNS